MAGKNLISFFNTIWLLYKPHENIIKPFVAHFFTRFTPRHLEVFNIPRKLLLFINFFTGNLCTYLNWPRAHRCTQCSTPRRRVSPGARKNASTPEVVQSNSSQPPTLENLRISTPPPSKWSCKYIYLQKNITIYYI